MPASESVKLSTPRGALVRASLHRPFRPNGAAVVLAPGQGYHCEKPLLKRGAEALAEAGFVALRFDWAYFTAGAHPSADLAAEREDLGSALDFARRLEGVHKVVVAGKSLGSTVALSRAAARADDLAGLALLTFPLSGPESPEAAALAGLTLPTLVVCGDRDPLCSLEALYVVAAKCKAPPRLVVVPGDHSLARSREDDSETAENVDLAVRALVVWAKRFAVR